MKKRIIFLLFLLSSVQAYASHIVGGEFELTYLSPGQYRLNLILYFDVRNGSPGARDVSITAGIFSIRTNAMKKTLVLPLVLEENVVYSQLACTIAELNTRKMVYSAILSLPDEDFSDSQGYYVSWLRCCRNYTITNIQSNPPGGGQYAGQTFYLEIPPVVKDGLPFINSSPRLFPPLSDYACVGKPYYVDFAGIDDDGDSLVYQLVTPLNTPSAEAIPLPTSKPYPPISWSSGFGLENIMNGSPDLAISTDGILTVTPGQTGLFVFAVACFEYRDGKKIGETRRDFQMLVESCPSASAPIVKGRKLGESAFTYLNNMTVVFPPLTQNDNRCIEIEITDEDIFEDGSEFVAVKGIIGLDNKINKKEVLLPSNLSATLTPGNPSIILRICFDDCPPQKNATYRIGIIVRDDACALPLLDTLRVTVLVETPPNSPAKFIEPVPDVTQSLFEGTSDQWPVEAIDNDGDTLTLSFLTDGFNLNDFGMDLSINQPQINTATGSLVWDAKCDEYDFSLRQTFQITLLADDADLCSYNLPDTAYFNLRLVNPSADPVIDTDITPVYSERLVDGGIHRIYDGPLQFNLFGFDADPFPIALKAEGVDFELSDYAITFSEVSGNSPIQSPFAWTLSCSQFNLVEKDTFAIRFMVIDNNNKCKIYQADTVEVGFKILPPINNRPLLTIDNLNPETNVDVHALKTFWDKPVELLLTGTDEIIQPGPDHVTIELLDVESSAKPPEGYTFTPVIPVTGLSQVQTRFSWQPDCSIFDKAIFDNTYTFTFRVVDDHCESPLADTVSFQVNINDYVSTDENFVPPNVITPNGDAVNDFFSLDGYEIRMDGSDPDSEINLPLDNCLNQFESISIYNRWGKLMFTSRNRFFKWYAPNVGAGVYYYLLKFTRDEYKGSVMVRY